MLAVPVQTQSQERDAGEESVINTVHNMINTVGGMDYRMLTDVPGEKIIQIPEISNRNAEQREWKVMNNGALTFYFDRAAFEALYPGLESEDFEAGNVAPGGVAGFPHPLDSSSNNPVFSPGDIAEGIQFWASGGTAGSELVIVGAGFNNNPSKQVLANTFVETFEIVFTTTVNVAGFDLVSHTGADVCEVEVFDVSDVSLGSTTQDCNNAGSAFLGVVSSVPIGRIHIASPTDQAEGVDNVLFGLIPQPEIAVSPESFDVAVEPGGIIYRNLTISNVGEGVLDFSLSATEVNPAGYPIQRRPVSAGSASNGTRGPNTGSLQTNPWVTVSPTPLGVSRPGGAVVNGLLYVVGGESTGGERFGQVQIYDPATDTWDNASAPTMPTPVSNLCAAVIGTSIYVPGGWTGTVTEDALQVFDTATNSWSIVATDPLPAARYGSACANHNGKLYVFGGWDGAAGTNIAWVYDPDAAAGTRWSSLPDAPFNGVYGAALSVNERVFYGGVSDNQSGNFDDVAAYNPVGNEWITYPSLQTPRGGAGMWAIGDMLYIGGGGWTTFLTSVEAYNTSLGTGGSWEFTNSLNQGRRTFAYATDAVNGHLYAAAGWAGTFLTHAEKSDYLPWLSMDPTSGSVEQGGEITIVVTFDATDLEEDTYHAEIIVSSNDPDNPVVAIPVTLTVDASVGVKDPDVPVVYILQQNYPNPFNPSTTIRYGLPERSVVKLEIYNTLGQRVSVLVDDTQEAGFYEVTFDASYLSSGVYLYRLQAGEFVQTKKLLLLK